MEDVDVCRICRGEETQEEPLFHPCKCSGSIQYVHQDCLLEWLDHTTSLNGLKAQCDLCKEPYTLRKRFDRTMPSRLAGIDYLVYAYKVVETNSPYLYYFVRALVMVVAMALFVDISLATMLAYADAPTGSLAQVLATQKLRFTQPPEECLHSKATYIDYLLDFIVPPSCLRTSFVHGFLLIVSFILILIILWVVTMWVLNEETVRHDLDHISRGEISHMDEGDEEGLFEMVTSETGEGAPEPDTVEDAEIVPPSRDIIPHAPEHYHEHELELNPKGKPRAILHFVHETHADLFSTSPRKVDVCFVAAKMDQRQPYADLLDADDVDSELPPGVTREKVIDLVSHARKLYKVKNAENVPRDFLAELEFAQLEKETSYDEVDSESSDSSWESWEDSIDFGTSSEQYLELLGQTYKVSYVFNIEENRRRGRVILHPESDLYVDKEDLTNEMRALFQDVEDEEEIGLFFLQILGLFQRPNVETFAAFANVVVLALCLLTFYVMFYGLSLTAFRYSSLALYVLFTETPLKILGQFLPVRYFGYGFTYSPASLKGRLSVQFVTSVLSIVSVRYTVLMAMPRILKFPSGRQFLQVFYEVYVVTKALVMTAIETLVFPEFCGSLLHIVSIPLMSRSLQSGFAWHNNHYRTRLGLTLFLQWVAGYFYMHALQVMVAACRKTMRQGVLFFLQDSDAIYFLRSMLLVSLPKQIYRIAISAGIYGIMITLGIGSTTVLVRILEPQTWPMNLAYWPGLNILRMWWVCLFLRAFLVEIPALGIRTDRSIRYVFSRLWLRERVWLRILETGSRYLDLQSWLFGVPREIDDDTKQALARGDRTRGYFVRAPIKKMLKSRQNMQIFVPVDAQDRRLDGKRGVMDHELDTYTVVWRPQYFKARLAGLFTYMWATISCLALMLTLVPLKLGRALDTLLWHSEVKNDLLLFAAGLSILLPIYGTAIYYFPPREMRKSVRFKGIIGRVRFASRAEYLSSANLASAIIMTIVGLGIQPFYFNLFETATRSWFPTALLTVLNWAFFVAVNPLIHKWITRFRLDVLELLVLQSLLEVFGWSQGFLWARALAFGSAVAINVKIYRSSDLSKKVQDGVREANYLEAIEVMNYEGNTT